MKIELAKKAKETLLHTRRTIALVWASSPRLLLGIASGTLVSALLPVAIAYGGKRIMDAVVARRSSETARWVAIELALVLLSTIVMRTVALMRSILGSRLGVDINVSILERATALELKDFEDPTTYDLMTRARREASSRPLSLLSDALGLVQNAITLAGYAALLVQFSSLAVVGLLVSTIPATIAEVRYAKLGFRMRNWRSPESRKLYYYEYVLANDEHAKEVKLFGLGKHFLARYRDLAESFHVDDTKLATKRTLAIQVLSVLGTAAFYGCYAWMALAAARGQLDLGNMTMYVLAFRQGQSAFQSMLSSIGSLYEHNLYMANLFAFLETPVRADEQTTALTLAEPKSTASVTGAPVLVFDDVGFRYPGRDGWAVRHLDLTIPRGQKVALVGQNGAGKTTLIKLLTRLYEPTEGRILLDGKDLREWDTTELLARFGVVFQDFNQYQLKFRENVGLGSLPSVTDDAKILDATEKGGATPVLESLKEGLEAPLGRWFKDGAELSGGQWQKVALARAFMRESADILVLDEPTAALDAEAEHAVFERFHELAEGRTTFVISHRFPTVRMADRILVLEGGAVVEDGTHDDLVANDKVYARLFRMQAEGYL